jgi:hypothetical protein
LFGPRLTGMCNNFVRKIMMNIHIKYLSLAVGLVVGSTPASA